MNIKVFLNKSAIPCYISIPLCTLVFINILLILCFYIFSTMFLWLLILGGWILIVISVIISVIVGIYKENKKKDKCR